MSEAFILGVLALLALGRLPVLKLDRTGIALVGASVLVISGAVSFPKALGFIDGNTLVLLFGTMIYTAHLRLAGFFDWTSTILGRWAQSPRRLLLVLMGLSALLSALFINDTVCLALTPLVLDLTLGLGLNPLPYLMGLALSSNVGSMTTLIGNPQNILIGSSSGMNFGGFFLEMALPGLICLALSAGMICLVYHRDLRRRPDLPRVLKRVRLFKPLIFKCVLAFVGMVGAVVLGVPLAPSVLAGIGLLLLTRRVHPQKVFSQVDWNLLVMFAGLFVLTGVLETTSGFQWVFQQIQGSLTQSLGYLAGVTVILSNLISNVPAVMVLSPFIPGFSQPQEAWSLLAGASTLAGNLTLLGSVANLIVAETAQRRGIHLGFGEYLKTGLVSALLSLGVLVLWFL